MPVPDKVVSNLHLPFMDHTALTTYYPNALFILFHHHDYYSQHLTHFALALPITIEQDTLYFVPLTTFKRKLTYRYFNESKIVSKKEIYKLTRHRTLILLYDTPPCFMHPQYHPISNVFNPQSLSPYKHTPLASKMLRHYEPLALHLFQFVRTGRNFFPYALIDAFSKVSISKDRHLQERCNIEKRCLLRNSANTKFIIQTRNMVQKLPMYRQVCIPYYLWSAVAFQCKLAFLHPINYLFPTPIDPKSPQFSIAFHSKNIEILDRYSHKGNYVLNADRTAIIPLVLPNSQALLDFQRTLVCVNPEGKAITHYPNAIPIITSALYDYVVEHCYHSGDPCYYYYASLPNRHRMYSNTTFKTHVPRQFYSLRSIQLLQLLMEHRRTNRIRIDDIFCAITYDDYTHHNTRMPFHEYARPVDMHTRNVHFTYNTIVFDFHKRLLLQRFGLFTYKQIHDFFQQKNLADLQHHFLRHSNENVVLWNTVLNTRTLPLYKYLLEFSLLYLLLRFSNNAD